MFILSFLCLFSFFLLFVAKLWGRVCGCDGPVFLGPLPIVGLPGVEFKTMASASFVEILGGQNPRIVTKEMYRNLGQEISSLSYNEKRDKILEFLRRNAQCQINLTDLYNETQVVAAYTLSRWLHEIRDSAKVQPLVPASAAQGMASNNFRQAIGGSQILGHARRPCEFATGGGPVHIAGDRPWIVPVPSPGIYFHNAPLPSHPTTPSNPVS